MKAGPAEPAGPRMPGLDVLRFLAASVVICSHAHNFGDAGALFLKNSIFFNGYTASLGELGWEAVDVFFVLSGFLVSGLLFEEAARTGTVSVSRFLIRRGFKIYPGFWIMTAAFIVWRHQHGNPVSIKALCGELFYYQNYGFCIWGHTWSLAVEEHFYFLLAGMFFILKWRTAPGRSMSFAWIPKCFLTIAVICLLARAVTWWVILEDTEKNSFWFNRADHAVMDSLMLGVLLSHYWHHCRDQRARMKVLAWRVPLILTGLCLLLIEWTRILGIQWFRIFGFIPLYLGAGCLVLGALSLDQSPCPRWLRWAAWPGKYSYSVYLWHVLAGYWLLPLLGSKGDNLPGWILNALIYLAAAWAVGIILAWLIEFPALRLRDRFFPSLSRGHAG